VKLGTAGAMLISTSKFGLIDTATFPPIRIEFSVPIYPPIRWEMDCSVA